MSKRLIIIDVSSFIFRAYYAIRPMHTPEGTQVNAVYGVLSMVTKLLNDFSPTHVFIAKDTKRGSFRNEIYPEYKANRSAPPEDLIPQFDLIKKMITLLGISEHGAEGFEADDVIGSVIEQYKNDFDEVFIATSDKDLMQFVSDKVKILDTMKSTIYGPDEVKEKMGVFPHQIIDYLSLLGDASDNIPGVKGIGAKGAQKLLEEYEYAEKAFDEIENITTKRLKNSLSEGRESFDLSKELVTIKTDIDLAFKAEDFSYEINYSDEFKKFLLDLNFNSFLKKIESGGNTTRSSVKYKLIETAADVKNLLNFIEGEDQIGLEVFYKNDYINKLPDYISISVVEESFVLKENIDEFIKGLQEIEDIKIISSDTLKLHALGLKGESFDVTQAHFILYPDQKHDLSSISLKYTSKSLLQEKEFDKMGSDEKSENFFIGELAKRSWCVLNMYPALLKELFDNKLYDIYEDIDQKLIPVIYKMEQEGIFLDKEFFKDLEFKFETELKSIEEEIFKEAGTEVNLRSPKQVGELLFEKLGLPIIKKNKTGPSTASDVLTKLEAMDISKVPALILKTRELEKLLSTYIKTFPTYINETTGRIHPHFRQDVASTGRLSCENPNLQNIPIRTENGRKLREGFLPKKGYVFVGGDYSQVELRILAHFSEDEVMVDAFMKDEDIHLQTAKEVFGKDDINKEERNFAKAINFGLMYGQTSYGLSETLGITPGEAKSYITKYFTRFHKVKSYLDSLKEDCEKHGYTQTMFGRKRVVPEIHSKNRMVKAQGERVAINTPIQGTAADIIKMSMIEIDEKLKSNSFNAKMLLQVHDELIFEVKEDEAQEFSEFLKKEMESIVKLKVPLKVDVAIGSNWFEI